MQDPWFRNPFVEFIQKHSIKGASTNRDGQRMAPQTPRDGLPGLSNVMMPPSGERRADEEGCTKTVTNLNTRKTQLKGCKHSYERTPYQRRDGGDTSGKSVAFVVGSIGKTKITVNAPPVG